MYNRVYLYSTYFKSDITENLQFWRNIHQTVVSKALSTWGRKERYRLLLRILASFLIIAFQKDVTAVDIS